MWRLPLLVLFFYLCFSAQALAPPTFEARMRMMAPVYWHGYAVPCNGQYDVHMNNLPGKIAGLAVVGGCDMWMDRRDWVFPVYCAVFLHEYGHLLGIGHSTNPHSVMFPIERVPPRFCWPS